MTTDTFTFIHTSDWHIGQVFHGFERIAEHRKFLDWLLDTLACRQPDALLIAGDIFDHANPSGQAQSLFYRFLGQARNACPAMDMVIIAGNHDSAARLEAPHPLLTGLNIHVIGRLDPHADPDKALIPLTRADGRIGAWCLGVPYLRPGDVPRIEGEDSLQRYPRGIAETYRRHVQAALHRRDPDQALVAMGHLHARGGTTSEDSERRLVIGGEEAVDAGIFAEELAYVALGHLHLAQTVGNTDHIRYCGSPLPLSFSETRYPHQIVEIRLNGAGLSGIEPIPVPRPVDMLRIPDTPEPLERVLQRLTDTDFGTPQPGFESWLEVRVLLEGPEPGLRRHIEQALEDKPVRLVKITPSVQHSPASTTEAPTALELRLDQPHALFERCHIDRYGTAPDATLMALFAALQDQAWQDDKP